MPDETTPAWAPSLGGQGSTGGPPALNAGEAPQADPSDLNSTLNLHVRRALAEARVAQLQEIIRWGQAAVDGRDGMFWSRFEQAATNQIYGGDATVSRYEIWLQDVTLLMRESLNHLEGGDRGSAMMTMAGVATALTAFVEVQRMMAHPSGRS